MKLSRRKFIQLGIGLAEGADCKKALPSPVRLSCFKGFFMYYLYILYSLSADKFYVGYTNNYLRRFDEHNNGEHLTFTSKHRPWTLAVVYQCGKTVSEAVKIEKFIKKQKSRKLIEKIIAGNELNGILAQLVRVPQVRD